MPTDYYPLISRAIASLEPNNESFRQNLYSRAREELSRQLRSLAPSMPEADVRAEQSALEAAIQRIERQASGINNDTPPDSSENGTFPTIAKSISNGGPDSEIRWHVIRWYVIAAVGLVLAVSFFFSTSGIDFAELEGWGTTKGLNSCRQNAIVQGAQSGVSSAQEVLVTKCFERHQSPIFANISGQASFQQAPPLPPVFVGWFVNSTADYVVTEYEISATPKQNSLWQISHRFVNAWVEPGQRTNFSFQVNQMTDVNAFNWSILNLKGVKVAF